MKLYGGIYFNENGISTSIRGMHMQTELMGVINQNVVGFNKVGYQKQQSVISSFAEYIGVHGLSNVKDEGTGRISLSGKPLDFALGKPGYFQIESPDGVELSRDGRFKMGKDGQLLNLEGFKVLGNDGMPIVLNHIPESVDDVKVGIDGSIKVLDRKSLKLHKEGALSVVASDGSAMKEVDVRQGFVEKSNVSLQEEFFHLIPTRRNFEANRQMYLTQNDILQKTISELGRGS